MAENEYYPDSAAATQNTHSFSRESLSDKLAELSLSEAETVAALPSGSALLVVVKGPAEGARFLLDHDVTTVGRHPNADIFLDDVTVSRRHAEFVRSGAQFAVRDLGSLNGTYVEGEAVESQALRDGAEVQIGKFKLTFFAAAADVAGQGSVAGVGGDS